MFIPFFAHSIYKMFYFPTPKYFLFAQMRKLLFSLEMIIYVYHLLFCVLSYFILLNVYLIAQNYNLYLTTSTNRVRRESQDATNTIESNSANIVVHGIDSNKLQALGSEVVKKEQNYKYYCKYEFKEITIKSQIKFKFHISVVNE